MSDANVHCVWGKGNPGHEDIWDDSALIKAYDEAVNLAKEEVAKQMGREVPNSESNQKSQNHKQPQSANRAYKEWFVGARCRAIYSEDDKAYEAKILNIDGKDGTCTVKFVGYGNTEKVELSSLLESESLASQIAQKRDALAERITKKINEKVTKKNAETEETNFTGNVNSKQYNGVPEEKMDCESEEAKAYRRNFVPGPSFNSSLDTMPPAPPLPPQLMAKLPDNEADALSSMLMSWYISGFHTGYYHGLKQARSNQEKQKNC